MEKQIIIRNLRDLDPQQEKFNLIMLPIISRKPYLPTDDQGKQEWLKNFNEELPALAAVFNITPAQLTSLDNDYKMFKWIMETGKNFEEKFHAYIAYKDLLRDGGPSIVLGDVPGVVTPDPVPTLVAPGIFSRTSLLVAIIKGDKVHYNDEVAGILKIEGTETVTQESNLLPTLKGRQVPGSNAQVALKTTLKPMKAYNVYVDRTTANVGDPQFVKIDKSTKAKYVDTFTLPVGVKITLIGYIIRFVENNVEVGEFSAPIWVEVKRNG